MHLAMFALSPSRLCFPLGLSLSLSLSLSVAPAVAAPKVVASIVPVHSLVASVMAGAGTPDLLLSGQTSEHQASFSPQQIKLLGDADVVFIIGQGLELKLDQLNGTEAVKGRRFVELSSVKGLVTLPVRQGGAFEKHEHHDGEEAGHDHEDGHDADHDADHDAGKATFDPHLWLDPANAKVMAAAIAEELSKADPGNAAVYAKNASTLGEGLDALAAELGKELAGLGDKPFVVQHDAYQYFEARFGLQAAGSIADISANDPSAQRLKEVRDKLRAVHAVCVFREPQFSDKAANLVTEGTPARASVLDPVGATLTPGMEAYGTLLRTLARNLKSCLSG